ncbi:MAG: DNA mismatch repair endonuclease MutL [Lactobacillaceae bacterium]|jgi:DNA mismatch repair protein MutL|nr:DNA mismatch repair endonuclease MutL [Lactobacillaceae bacterium]
MAEIHELPDVLANQIAAGEVVERPASVVKELVENAIDGNAKQIDVLVEEAGVQSIRVIDDGDGIDADQVARAFLRHATSKIANRNDLFRVHSLGFRGEALPSIASIADVVLETATIDDDQGSLIHFKGGQLLEEKGTGARKGTDITVRDLFYNTPARLKYLKSQATELAQIVDILNRLSFSYPNIAFRLSHNGKELLRTTGNGNLQQVIASVYGLDQARQMVEINAEDNDFAMHGFVSLPELTRSNRSYISILINGRYIKNYNLAKALVKGYGTRLMVGRFPMAVLSITMDPLLVDVNVHPQKHEVRLSKETQLMDLIEQAVRKQFAQTNLIPDAYENYLGKKIEPATDNTTFIGQLNEASKPYIAGQPGEHSAPITDADYQKLAAAFSPAELNPVVVHDADELTTEAVQAFTKKYANEAAVSPFGETGTAMPGAQIDLNMADQAISAVNAQGESFPTLDYIGQMHGTFLFAQSADGLYLIDQHAAQERVKYEYYRDEIGKVGLEAQKLLIPIVLEYSTSEMLQIAGHQAELSELGLQLEAFGTNSIIVREHPGWFEKGQEEATIKEMVDWLLRYGNLTVAAFRERTAIMMSCKRSIKANWALNDSEARSLITQLSHAENPYNCPHGRPVVVNFTLLDMEKMFKRIQDSHEAWIEYDNHPF